MSRTAVTRTAKDIGIDTYKTSTDVVYLPSDVTGLRKVDITYPAASGQKFPICIVIHGGTWEGGDKQSSTNVPQTAAAFAAAGYVVFNTNYIVAGGVNQTPSYGRTYISDELNDLITLWNWIQTNGTTYGGDINRIVVLGGSAGGHMATLLALQGKITPKIVIDWSGPTKFDDNPDGSGNLGPPYDTDIQWCTGYNDPASSVGTANDWYKLSPYYLVTNPSAYGGVTTNLPYFLIQHEVSDNICPVNQARKLDSAMTAAGIAHTYQEYSNSPHAFTAMGDFLPLALSTARSKVGQARFKVTRTTVSRKIV